MTDPIFDTTRASAELKIKPEIYVRILNNALKQTDGDLENLKQAHAQNNVDQVQAISHRLKGDYANLRIQPLSEVAARLNVLAKGEYQPDQGARLIQEFADIYNRIKPQIPK